MNQHPLSAAFPAMSTLEMADLENDIRSNGLRVPIVLFDGMVLDGWHRYTACRKIGIEPASVELAAELDPMAYVRSANLHRRHLDSSQRAAAVTACGDWARNGDNQHPRGGAAAAPMTVKQMAEVAGVSVRTIQQAKAGHSAGLGDAMRDGKITAERAAEIAKLPESERKAAIEAPKAPKATDSGNAPLPTDVMALRTKVKELTAEIEELAAALEASEKRVSILESAALAHVGELREMTRKYHLADDRARVAKGTVKRSKVA